MKKLKVPRGLKRAQRELVNVKVSRNPNDNWTNDAIQFPRLIAETQACGGFTSEVMHDLSESMDLSGVAICELLNRADVAWEAIKKQT